MKKIAILMVFVFAIAFTANVAFAHSNCGDCNYGKKDDCKCPETNVINVNAGAANTNVKAISGTGNNSINPAQAPVNGIKHWGCSKPAPVSPSASITTGNAAANAGAYTGVNTNVIEVKTTPLGKMIVFNANLGYAKTNVLGLALTGSNSITGAGDIDTGDAKSIADATTFVNTNTIKVDRSACCDADDKDDCNDCQHRR